VDLRQSSGLDTAKFERTCVSLRSRLPEGVIIPICRNATAQSAPSALR
jgi:hypothetical protein